MVMCWAPECKHYNQRETCKLFKFPKDAKERMRWKKFIRRSEEPGPGAFLCSCDFPGGKRENGPQLFQHNITKRFSYTSPEKKDKKRLKLTRSDVAEALANITRTQSEIATMVPRSSMTAQKATYSAYKHKNTWKALIGVAPNGVVTFVSDLYPGSTSDKKIVQHCKTLEQMETGDLILADKGFLLKDILPPGVNLNIPPFLVTSQFTPEQVYRTETIARARIHVERAIRRMKCYKILDFIPYSLQSHASCVVQVIGALTNLQPPLIREFAQAYSASSDNE
ncbi:hypothetical protein NQ314_016567 [Rhamnusium bicolor]|uniref:THAP-type domain-containing protein n=1 Tax=Rhamnusium bicolor TaxID=1586634 RepID=A0AAV8WWK7_9CUCU|nr:hypothetical protein NQ314_016567 [Rhamnusium bicolor]